MPAGRFEIKEFCECGSAIHATGPLSQKIKDFWDGLHSGPGHEERVTAPQANAIRAELWEKTKRSRVSR